MVANLQCMLNSLFQALSLFRSSVLTEGLEQPTVKKAFFEKTFFSAHGFKNSDHTRTNFIIMWISCLWRRCSTVCLQVCRLAISWPSLLSPRRELLSIRATKSRARLGKKLMERTFIKSVEFVEFQARSLITHVEVLFIAFACCSCIATMSNKLRWVGNWMTALYPI